MRRHESRGRSRRQNRPSGSIPLGLMAGLSLVLLWSACSSTDTSKTEKPPPEVATPVDLTLDSDKDGLTDAVEAKLGTSPFLADTDGDGYDDGTEIELNPNLQNDPYRFNPLIADVPRLAVEFVTAPKVYITYTDARGKETRLENATSDESSLRSSNSSSVSDSLNWELSVTAGFATKVGILDGGVSYNASITGSVGGEKTSTWSQEVARENRKTLSESRALSESKETVSSGATVEMTINVRNVGNLAFTIETLGLNVVKLPVDGGPPIGIGRLAPKGGNGSFFSQGTLRPGEGLEGVVCDISDINLAKAEELLKEGAFQVRSSQFELLDRDGRPFDQRFTEIAARTASISIDSGPEVPSQEYLVAIPMVDGKGRALGQLMKDVLRMDYRTGTVVWNYPDGIRASGNGLVSLGRYAADSKLGAYWIVSVISKELGRDVQRTYNLLEKGFDFDGLEIRPGDQVHLVYISDPDLDGLGDRLELLKGTDPRLADTDGDGMKDGEELLHGRNPLVDDRIPLPVLSEPGLETFDRTVALSGRLENAGGEPGFGLWIGWGDGGPPEWVAADRSAIEVSHRYDAYGRYSIVATPAGPHDRRGKSLRLEVQVQRGWKPAWSRPFEDPLGHVVAASDGIYAASALRIGRYTPEGSRPWLVRPDLLAPSRLMIRDLWPTVRPGGGVIVAAADGNADVSRLFHLDHLGHVVWTSKEGSGGIHFIREDAAGNLYVAGELQKRPTLAKLSPEGKRILGDDHSADPGREARTGCRPGGAARWLGVPGCTCRGEGSRSRRVPPWPRIERDLAPLHLLRRVRLRDRSGRRRRRRSLRERLHHRPARRHGTAGRARPLRPQI